MCRTGSLREGKDQILGRISVQYYRSDRGGYSSIILNLTLCNDILLWMFHVAHVCKVQCYPRILC